MGLSEGGKQEEVVDVIHGGPLGSDVAMREGRRMTLKFMFLPLSSTQSPEAPTAPSPAVTI